MMKKNRILVVQKARYIVLLVPLAWLLFSIWFVIEEEFPKYGTVGIQTTISQPSVFDLIMVFYFVIWVLWIFFNMRSKIKNDILIPAEQKSAFAFILGGTIMAISANFQTWKFLPYLGLAISDIAPVIMIITLLKGKPFGLLKLYHKDIQISDNV